MPYASKKALGGVYLVIPVLMVMIYGRMLILHYSSVELNPSNVIIGEICLIGGGLALIIGLILLGVGIPETKKARRILEIVSEKSEVTISEISTQTGLSAEYIRKVISELIDRGYLSGFLEDDHFDQRPLYDG